MLERVQRMSAMLQLCSMFTVLPKGDFEIESLTRLERQYRHSRQCDAQAVRTFSLAKWHVVAHFLTSPSCQRAMIASGEQPAAGLTRLLDAYAVRGIETRATGECAHFTRRAVIGEHVFWIFSGKFS